MLALTIILILSVLANAICLFLLAVVVNVLRDEIKKPGIRLQNLYIDGKPVAITNEKNLSAELLKRSGGPLAIKWGK